MNTLWKKVVGCDYKEYDRKLTKQFIHGLDDIWIGISEILREVSALNHISDATSERVLLQTQKVEAQRVLRWL